MRRLDFELVRIRDHLPVDMERLAEVAASEGVGNVGMLIEAWKDRSERFERDGAALYGAVAPDGLLGIGGVTREVGLREPAMRMRRFYILPEWRGQGIGRSLAGAAMRHGLASAHLLTCNARATPLAPPFWEAMGFVRSNIEGLTHIYRAQNLTET